MAGNVPVRIYIPKNHDMNTTAPVMFYYHGGGYCFGELGTLIRSTCQNNTISEINVYFLSNKRNVRPDV